MIEETNNINNINNNNIENNIFKNFNFKNVKTEINVGDIVCNEKNNDQTQRIIFDIPFTNTPKLAIYFKSISQSTISNVKYLSCNVSNIGFDFKFNYLNDKINSNEFCVCIILFFFFLKIFNIFINLIYLFFFFFSK